MSAECSERRPGDEECCVHHLPSPIGEAVCCWCGDIFAADWAADGKTEHGEYAPASPAPALCQCSDCLAHRDPAEYGDRAKMVAAIEELRGALKRVLEEADSVANAHIETEFCGSRFAVFVLPDAVATRAEAALKSTARWAHDA